MQPEPVVVPISPRHTPPRTPTSPRIIIQPTRQHQPEIIIEPRRSRSQRYRPRYREHERPAPARHSPRHSREEKRGEKKPRSPSPETLIRKEVERRRREERHAREEARIDNEIRRLNDMAERRRIDRLAADLTAEIQEQERARRQVRVVVHQDPLDYDLVQEDRRRRAIYRTEPRERSRSSSRGRDPRRVLQPLRRLSRSADRGRGAMYIEAAPLEYDFIPVQRRGRSMSEVGPRPRHPEYVLYEDEDRRYRRRR